MFQANLLTPPILGSEIHNGFFGNQGPSWGSPEEGEHYIGTFLRPPFLWNLSYESYELQSKLQKRGHIGDYMGPYYRGIFRGILGVFLVSLMSSPGLSL